MPASLSNGQSQNQSQNHNNNADLPTSWHSGPSDSFHGKITPEGPFKPEKGRYHLYIGLFCPFAHRANLLVKLKQLDKYAGITTSIVKPYPKGDSTGWPGWEFNLADAAGGARGAYKGATIDHLFGSTWMHQLYFRADPEYKGRYSVPVLWDKQRNTIVNNESAELMRDLNTCFNSLLPKELAELDFYPEEFRKVIEEVGGWMQRHLNSGVYKAGFAPSQEQYNANLPPVFAALNVLEAMIAANGGPFVLGTRMTELDIRAYATVIRFDAVYVQHFKCNLATIRHDYPNIHNWMKNLYHDHKEFGEFKGLEESGTVDFRHIKENYTKSHGDINPLAITPLGPWPNVEDGVEGDWAGLRVGRCDMPEVVEYEKKIREESGQGAQEGNGGFSLDNFKVK